MDDPHLDVASHRAALVGLARLNRFTFVAPAIYRRIRRYARTLRRPLKVLDIATGSGDMPIYWAKKAKRERLPIDFTGVDYSPTAIDFATSSAERASVDVHFMQRDVLADRLPSGFDVITCGLFIHHLDEAQITKLLQSMQSAANHALIICDLERSALNLSCVWFAAHAVTRSPIVHGDAVKSVRAALTRHEFASLARQSLGRPVRVEGLPPCRFIASIDEATARAPEVALAGVHAT
jgi:2-polyprenyl-3-methyl-5-hydroxy-6-metoxy-1,4-benzoquinol methylase